MQLLQILGYLVALLVLGPGGNAFTRFVLWLSKARKLPKDAEQSASRVAADEQISSSPQLAASSRSDKEREILNAGRYIGLLERLLILIGLVLGKWEVILAVIALKTVARHSELNQRIAAEYFLIGSLASIFWAVLVAGGLIWFDQSLGFHLLTDIFRSATING